MPTVSPPALILVTGATGYVGTHTVTALTAAGYRVRTAVRSKEKGEYMAKTFGATYVVVPDITAAGAYGEAIKDVDAVVHLASPLDVSNTGDPEAVIGPAVKGVTGLLDSISKQNGRSVKRVVLMSSVAATGSLGSAVRYTESDWNDAAVSVVEKQGASAPGVAKYFASKALAERAFWDNLRSPSLSGVDGVSLLPALIEGPPSGYSEAKGVASITGTVGYALQHLSPDAELDKEYFNVVDVRDVAAATVTVLQDDRAEGRYLLSVGTLFGNDFAAAVNVVFPERKLEVLPQKERQEIEARGTIWDGGRITKELGFKYTDKEKTMVDTYEAIKAML